MPSPRSIAMVLLLAAGAARADNLDDKLAKRHFTTGQDYFTAARYEPAVKEFLEAYRLSRRVDLLYNIALCYEKLDDAGRTTSYLRRYLEARSDAPDRIDAVAKIERLAARVATLHFHTGVPGTPLYVDGELVGLAPADPVLLTEGRHRLEARFAEHAPVVSEVELGGGRATTITLDPKVEPAPAVEKQRAPEPPRVTPPPPAVVAAPPPPVTEAPKKKRWWIAGVVAGVVVVAAGAVVAGVLLAPGGTDHGANARSSCGSPSCTLVDLR